MRVAIIGAVLAAVLAASPSSLAAPSAATTGVVVVNTRLAYGGGGGAGTGIVLTSSGTVLTNNHVIRGAGSVRVTVPSSGRTYAATVAGYSVSKDIALLELRDAQGLETVRTGNSNTVDVGDRVTAVGNGGGAGLTTKTGRVTGLGQSITVSNDGDPFTLPGLIETTTPLRSGDSGGPLLSGGRVIGIDAAASGGFLFRASAQGYAIPINRALKIAGQIEAGRRSSTVHVGPTAFLGVALRSVGDGDEDVSGAVVESALSGSPADRAGIGANDVITSFAGKRVSSASSLRKLVLQASPGNTVRVTWIDPSAGRTSAAVRLVAGPPQ
ncbi:MAG: S1C family serine protease [Gaiellaceae bacterium]